MKNQGASWTCDLEQRVWVWIGKGIVCKQMVNDGWTGSVQRQPGIGR